MHEVGHSEIVWDVHQSSLCDLSCSIKCLMPPSLVAFQQLQIDEHASMMNI